MTRDWRKLIVEGEVDEYGDDLLTDEEIDEINQQLQDEYEELLAVRQEESCPE